MRYLTSITKISKGPDNRNVHVKFDPVEELGFPEAKCFRDDDRYNESNPRVMLLMTFTLDKYDSFHTNANIHAQEPNARYLVSKLSGWCSRKKNYAGRNADRLVAAVLYEDGRFGVTQIKPFPYRERAFKNHTNWKGVNLRRAISAVMASKIRGKSHMGVN